MWAQLQDQIKIRTKRLASAAEIHGFNRDLNELIARLQEKDASLSMEDLGRDMASVQGLQRKHEGHERDLVVVQKQVETLSAQSAKLQVAYQGEAINMLYFLYLLLFSTYRKIPKISLGAYIFQRLFLRGLFLEGLIFGGAYLRREICVSKSIGLTL